MTDKNTAGDPIPEGNPNSSATPEIEVPKSGGMDSRNLISGNERLERSESKKPLTFSDVDEAVSTPPEKPAKKAEKEDDDEFADEDLEDDLDGEDEDDDLEETEEELDEEEDDEEESEEEETEETDETTEAEAGKADPYDKKVIKVKVNGKWKEYTGKQMKDLVASGAHLEEQRTAFRTEVATRKKDFETSMAKLKEADELLTPLYTAAKDGKIQEAVIRSCELNGMTKVQAKWKLIEEMLPVVSSVLGIAEENLTARIKERMPHIRSMQMRDENEFFKEQSANPKSTPEKDADKAGFEEVQGFMDEHDISRPQLRNAVSWLKENTYKGKEGEITLPVIGQFISAKRAIDKAFTAIGAVRPNLAGDSKFADRVIAVAKKKPDWTADKLARWVAKQARDLKRTKVEGEVNELRRDVSRKVLKANNKAALKKDTPNSQRKPKTFADLGDDGSALDI